MVDQESLEKKRVLDTEKALFEIQRLLSTANFTFKYGTRDFISALGKEIRPVAKTFLIDVTSDAKFKELCDLMETWGKPPSQKGIMLHIRQCNFCFDEENWGYPEGETRVCELWLIKDPKELHPFGLNSLI